MAQVLALKQPMVPSQTVHNQTSAPSNKAAADPKASAKWKAAQTQTNRQLIGSGTLDSVQTGHDRHKESNDTFTQSTTGDGSQE